MKTEIKKFIIWFSICAITIFAFLGFVSLIVYVPAMREAFNNFYNQDIQATPFKYVWRGWLLTTMALSFFGGLILPGVWEGV